MAKLVDVFDLLKNQSQIGRSGRKKNEEKVKKIVQTNANKLAVYIYTVFDQTTYKKQYTEV